MKDNNTGKNSDFYALGKKMFDRLNPITQDVTQIPQEHSSNEQEPAGWQWMGTAHYRKHLPKDAEKYCWKPLYTSPPKRKEWVELTLAEFGEIYDSYGTVDGAMEAVETKLKEKNT